MKQNVTLKAGGRRAAACALALAALLLTCTVGMALAAPAGLPVLDVSSIFSSYFSASAWYGLAAIVAVAVISAAALVYMLGKMADSQNAIFWARAQIYEALLGIVFIAIFFVLYSWLLVNPQGSFASANLVPSQCTSASDIYALSDCDLGSFLSTSTQWFSYLFYASYVLGLTSGLSVSYSFASGSTSIGTKLDSLMPSSAEETLAVLTDLLLPAIMLNELQMILLSGAPLLFAMLLMLGITAWMIGFSRKFGGTMIALAIGFGIVYPLLIAVTYGFVDIRISMILPDILSKLAVALQSLLAGLLTLQFSSLSSLAASVFSAGSYIFAGLVLVPILNFMILDAFVVDFSKAIGIRVTFMELLTNLV